MWSIEVLESELRNFQIDLPAEQRLTLARYCDELVHWNKKINLTGLSGLDMVRRLVIEPVWIGRQFNPRGILADIGSGNGSPGIPLHVVCEFGRTHLVEVRAKKAAFLRHLTTALKLTDVVVHRAMFEEIASELMPVDWISLQGVALSKQLIESIRKIAPTTTNIVWISSRDVRPPFNPERVFGVPFTGTKVTLFRVGAIA